MPKPGPRLNVLALIELRKRMKLSLQELARWIKKPPNESRYEHSVLAKMERAKGRKQPRNPVQFAEELARISGLPKENFLISYNEWLELLKEKESQ